MCPQFIAYLLDVKEERFEGFRFGGVVLVSGSLGELRRGRGEIFAGLGIWFAGVHGKRGVGFKKLIIKRRRRAFLNRPPSPRLGSLRHHKG